MPFGFGKGMLAAEISLLIFKGFAKQEAEIAAGLQASCPDFGKCRKPSTGSACIFSRRKAAAEMH
jgi:hypothetical protein